MVALVLIFTGTYLDIEPLHSITYELDDKRKVHIEFNQSDQKNRDHSKIRKRTNRVFRTTRKRMAKYFRSF